jgi:hypothetical protein
MIAVLLGLLRSPSAWLGLALVIQGAFYFAIRDQRDRAIQLAQTHQAQTATKAAELARCGDQVTTLTAGLEYATTTLHEIQAESERRRVAADAALKRSREAAARRRTTIDGQGAEELNTWLRAALP